VKYFDSQELILTSRGIQFVVALFLVFCKFLVVGLDRSEEYPEQNLFLYFLLLLLESGRADSDPPGCKMYYTIISLSFCL
jgi:hypothetical protein